MPLELSGFSYLDEIILSPVTPKNGVGWVYAPINLDFDDKSQIDENRYAEIA